MSNDERARELIGSIDHFHGNEMKDRTEASINSEVAVVSGYLAPRTVYVVTYSHKHGLDCCAYRTEAGALNAAIQLACERAGEWDDEEAKAKFEGIEDSEEALAYFHEVEHERAYSEVIEINERPLGD